MGNPRILGHGPALALIRFVDGIVAPPLTTDPVIYRIGDQVFFRDSLGNVYPLVQGADLAGVVVVTPAMSPYAVVDSDRVLLLDTRTGTITVTLPAAGGPVLGRSLVAIDAYASFTTHAATIDGNGHNVNTAGTMGMAVNGDATDLVWSGNYWVSIGGVGAAAPPAAHAPSHRAGGSDDLLSAPGAIGGTTPAPSIALQVEILPAVAAPVLQAGAVKQFAVPGPTGKQDGVGIRTEQGGLYYDRMRSASSSAKVVRDVFVQTIANGAYFDYDNEGKPGRIFVSALNALLTPGVQRFGTLIFGGDGKTALCGTVNTGVFDAVTMGANTCVVEHGGKVGILNQEGLPVMYLIEVLRGDAA